MNTCDTCQHWGDETGEEKRQCFVIDGAAHLDAAARELRTLCIGGMWTAPKFGCIYHKPTAEQPDESVDVSEDIGETTLSVETIGPFDVVTVPHEPRRTIMMEDQHSPVPWCVGMTMDTTYGSPWPVYRLRDMVNPTDETEIKANGRLMEKAPAMLALLRRWLTEYECGYGLDSPLSLDTRRFVDSLSSQ